MARKKKPRQDATPPAPTLSNNPFAALSNLRDTLPEAEPTTPSPAAPPRSAAPPSAAPPSAGPLSAAHAPPTAAPARAVVAYERKGRGGKEVTLVRKLDLPAADLDTLCRDLKRTLGCGGHVEGDTIILAGDQRDRLPALLTTRGIRRVTVA